MSLGIKKNPFQSLKSVGHSSSASKTGQASQAGNNNASIFGGSSSSSTSHTTQPQGIKKHKLNAMG